MKEARPRKLTNEPPPVGRARHRRWEMFAVDRNDDGTFQIIATSGDAEYVFADRFNSVEEAEWACGLFNAAIGYRGRVAVVG